MDTRLFKNKHENDGNYTRDKELRARELDSVDYRRIFVDNKNMYRKADRTRESEQFALAESRLAARTQQIESDNAEPDADPHGKTDAFFEENEADYRYEKHIERGYEADLADRCIAERRLLKIARHAENRSADKSADNKIFLSFFFSSGVFCSAEPSFLFFDF